MKYELELFNEARHPLNITGWKVKGEINISRDKLKIEMPYKSVSIRKGDLRILKVTQYKLIGGNPIYSSLKSWWKIIAVVAIVISFLYYDQGFYSIGGYIEGDYTREFFENDIPFVYSPMFAGSVLLIIYGLFTLIQLVSTVEICKAELIGNRGRSEAVLDIIQTDNIHVAEVIRELKSLVYE